VAASENADRPHHLGSSAAVSVNCAGIAGARVSSGQQLTGDQGQARQPAAAQSIEIDTPFAIAHLPHQEMMLPDGRPAEQQVRNRLDRSLALDNALALMIVASTWQVLAVNRLPRLLDLQKQRILRAVSFEQDDIVAQADAARSHDLESH